MIGIFPQAYILVWIANGDRKVLLHAYMIFAWNKHVFLAFYDLNGSAVLFVLSSLFIAGSFSLKNVFCAICRSAYGHAIPVGVS